MIRIYADVNNRDEQGRVDLSCVGSRRDLEKHEDALVDGLPVVLHAPGDFEVEGVLVREEIWLAVPDWDTLRYEDPPA